MTDPTLPPIPQTATVWPPAPVHNAVPPSLFVSAEGVEITQSGRRLVVVNKFTRRFLLLESCVLSCSFLSPWITFWTSRFHRHVLSGLLPYVVWSYQIGYPIYSIALLILFGVWCLGYFYLSLSGIILDKSNKTIRANGKVNPLSKIEAVRITSGQPDVLGRNFVVRLVWNCGRPIPWWRMPLVKTEVNTTFLGALRQEANAEKIAEAVAEFTGVPVQHRTIAENSV